MPHPSTVIPIPPEGSGPQTATNGTQKEANTVLPYGSEFAPSAAPSQAYNPPAAGGPVNVHSGAFNPQQPAAYYVQVPYQGRPGKDGWLATPDWLLFLVGCGTGVGWIVGAFLPLCRTPRFENKIVMGAWIANCAFACLVTTYFSMFAVFFGAIALYGL